MLAVSGGGVMSVQTENSSAENKVSDSSGRSDYPMSRLEIVMRKALVILSAFGLASSGLAVAYAREKAPEVRAVGEPKSCVSIQQIRSTKIVDDNIIDFKMAGGKTYRNTLPYGCSGLRRDDAFSYRTSTSQLCSVDIIRVVENYGGRLNEGAGCGLGKFQEVKRVNPAH